MKLLSLLLLCSFAAFSCRSLDQAATKPRPRPNVLFILVDDLGIKDLGYTGSTYYETPHIDSLAARSMVFTQGYAGSRVCSPSRATLLTGKFTARHGITDWIGAKSDTAWRKRNRHDLLLPAEYLHELPQEEITLAEALKAHGYQTFFAGKWHLGDAGSYPEDHGFDINIGGIENGSPPGGYFSPFNNPKLQDRQAGENLSLRLAQETATFIQKERQEPFFAMLSFYAVHGPVQTSQEKWQKYQQKAKSQGIAEQGFAMERKLPIRLTQDNPVYAGLVESMDEAVGIVLEALAQSGLAENTLVIFTSDNGGASAGDTFSTSNLPFRGGKGYQWEGGIREPFLIYVPWQNTRGRQSDEPVTGADFYPTLLDYANIDLLPAQHADGMSLRSIIEDGAKLPERPLFWHYPHYGNQGGDPTSIIRKGKWKFIHYYEDRPGELYDLEADPYEQHDLAGEFPEIGKALGEELGRWLASVNARYPEVDEQFDPEKRKKYDQNIRSKRLPKLEEKRREMLSDGFEPNPDWWGSKLTKD